jgi:inner membrane protein
MKDSFSKQNLTANEFVTTPTPLNNFLWMAYTNDSTGTYIGYYSIFDKSSDIEFHRVERNEQLVKPFEGDKSLAILKQFSKGHYVITKEDSTIFFNDIRFGQMGGWDISDAGFPFSYKLNRNADNSMALDRGKFKMSFADAFASLYTRVKGK